MKRLLSIVLSLMLLNFSVISAYAAEAEPVLNDSIITTEAADPGLNDSVITTEAVEPVLDDSGEDSVDIEAETVNPETDTPAAEFEPVEAGEAVGDADAPVDNIVIEDVTGTVENLPDSDELFENYVNDVFGIEEYSETIHMPPLYRNALDAQQKVMYDYLKAQIILVADGSISSSVFNIKNDIGSESLAYTAAELGVSAIISGSSVTEDASRAIRSKFVAVMDALILDSPYYLYWFDKVSGYSYSLAGSTSRLYISKISLKVSADYSVSDATGTYEADVQKTGAATTAAQTAQGVVSQHVTELDYDKLTSYKNYILDAVDYNYDVINTPTNYGDPWQLIWVFDGDPDTKVVCEGYSKAFQYLCNKSVWHDENFECRSVVGSMDGGGHMWNVVALGGNNYLVDVTNSEYQLNSGGGLSYSPGCAGKLFMAGASGGSVSDGYVISWESYQAVLGGLTWTLPAASVTYIYDVEGDSSTTTVYEEGELALSSSYYDNSGEYHRYGFNEFFEDDYGRPVAGYECDACGLKKNYVITKTEFDPYCFSYETSKYLLDTLLNTCGMGETDFSIHYEIVMNDGVMGTGTSGNPAITYNVFSVVAAYDGDTELGGVVIDNPTYIKDPEYSFALAIPNDWNNIDWNHYSIRVRLIGDDVREIGTFKPENDTVSITAPELGDFELELVKLESASYAATLTLEENIDINFYVNNLGDSSHPEYYWVVSSFAEGQANELSVSKNLNEAISTPNGYKIVVANVYPYQMTQDVHIEVFYGETLEIATGADPIFIYDYSVQDYFKGRIENSTNPDMQALAKAGLDYGANCQLFFNGKTYSSNGMTYTYDTDASNLANAEYNSGNIINSEKPEGYSAGVEGSIDGFSFKTASLVLGTEVSVRAYYKWNGNASDLTVKAVNNTTNNEKNVKLIDSDSGKYDGVFVIEGIKSTELSDKYTLTVTCNGVSTNLTYSPYTYAANKWNSGTEHIANLVKALVAYGDAADTYFGY